MEITGHSTREMFDRYNTVDKDDTRQAIDLFQRYLRQSNDQTIDQVARDGKQHLQRAHKKRALDGITRKKPYL